MRYAAKEKEIYNVLKEKFGDREFAVYYFDRVDSTMNAALEVAAPDCIGVVVAELQSAGRGTHGRVWDSSKKENIYLTLIMPVEGVVKNIAAFSLVVGYAIYETLIGVQGNLKDVLSLKWPNDLLSRDGKKLAGILIEGEKIGGKSYLSVGVGIDLKSVEVEKSTSLSEVGYEADKDDLISLVTRNIVAAWFKYGREGFAVYRDKWLSACHFVGQKMLVQSGEREYCGIMQGVTDEGQLLLQCDGETVKIYSGYCMLGE